ncbi:hypothetical protein TSAR_013593 [Trichomalopsis sarcophagae]|uniref:DUF659 domain-containing protein n=1 Tax=Trichomalopsis sarcophagae TaxID=543379 RepID=A0A232EED3_9HYME|nr:hypothetical protein TSAR_013593 [Trichomalopsis sarcophagae]
MTRKLESRYNIMKEAFIKELEDVPYYCLTADNWTDSSNQCYIDTLPVSIVEFEGFKELIKLLAPLYKVP